MTKKEGRMASPIGKQTKAEKKLYAKIRHSKKQAKAATRQGGYWRDIPGESNPQQNEHRLIHPALIQSGNVTVWIRPDGKEIAQHVYQAKDTVISLANAHRHDKQGTRNLARIEAVRCLFEGERPAMTAPAIAAFRLACREYLATLPLRYDGNRARVAAERRQARRLLKAWGGDTECPVSLAMALLHGPEQAVRMASVCRGMTATLTAPGGERYVPEMGANDRLLVTRYHGERRHRAGYKALLVWCARLTA